MSEYEQEASGAGGAGSGSRSAGGGGVGLGMGDAMGIDDKGTDVGASHGDERGCESIVPLVGGRPRKLSMPLCCPFLSDTAESISTEHVLCNMRFEYRPPPVWSGYTTRMSRRGTNIGEENKTANHGQRMCTYDIGVHSRGE